MSDQVEVCPLSRGVVTPILPITGRHSLPPLSHTRRPIGLPYGKLSRVACPPGDLRAYHVPCQYPRGLGSASPPGVTPSAIGELGAPIPAPLPFWPKPVNPCGVRLSGAAGATQHLWLVLSNDVYRRFAYANHITQSEPPTALVLAVATSSHDSAAIPGVQPAGTELSGEGYTCPQSFTPHRYQ